MPSEAELLEMAKAAALEAFGSTLSEVFPRPKCAICGAENARFLNVTIIANPVTGGLLDVGPMTSVCGDCCHKPAGF